MLDFNSIIPKMINVFTLDQLSRITCIFFVVDVHWRIKIKCVKVSPRESLHT